MKWYKPNHTNPGTPHPLSLSRENSIKSNSIQFKFSSFIYHSPMNQTIPNLEIMKTCRTYCSIGYWFVDPCASNETSHIEGVISNCAVKKLTWTAHHISFSRQPVPRLSCADSAFCMFLPDYHTLQLTCSTMIFECSINSFLFFEGLHEKHCPPLLCFPSSNLENR